jgi:hypothetical protein
MSGDSRPEVMDPMAKSWTRPQPRTQEPAESGWSATVFLERTTGFEPATPTLAKGCWGLSPEQRRRLDLGRELGIFVRMQAGHFAS